MLEKYNFTFHYKYFTSALIGFTFTERFSEDFSSEEQAAIQSQFSELIKYFIKGKYECYIFQIEESKYCVIANSDNTNMHQVLLESIQNFQKILNLDNDYIIMYAGIVQTYDKLENIHLSWKEARSVYYNLSPLHSFTRHQIICNYNTGFIKNV